MTRMSPRFRPALVYPAFLRHPSGMKASLCDAGSVANRARQRGDDFSSSSLSSLLFEHDLFGKPVSTFPDHAPRPTECP
jgi:hypothetical protein